MNYLYSLFGWENNLNNVPKLPFTVIDLNECKKKLDDANNAGTSKSHLCTIILAFIVL